MTIILMMNLKTYRQLFENVDDKYDHMIISMRIYDFINHCKLSYPELEMFKMALMKSESDISYIDISDEIDSITYLPYSKYRLISKYVEDPKPMTSTYRQKMKIGRFIRKIYLENDIKITDQQRQIDDLVEIYKKFVSTINGKFKINKVYGENIRKWYLEDNYADGNGTLNKSCMKQKENQHRLDLYVDNPEVVSLLIMLDENNKLLGRALMWKLDDGDFYMDRIYTVNSYERLVFNDYAKENNINLTYDKLIKMKETPKISVTIRDIDYGNIRNYPYMDTFKYYYKNINKLMSYFNNKIKPIPEMLNWN